ncbi:hypothetical protein [Exiguobacterium sp. s193]|uniref:hypothetical protein n=1 Tax=Exiguobacterium sp. s193 TaxID=2751207 RepID=UPI001BE820A4|nr:hypothetical protein [Exiguobacterium sp. s193]
MYQIDFTVVQYVNRQVRVEPERKTEPVARINPIERIQSHDYELEEQANAYGVLPELKLPGRKFDREV